MTLVEFILARYDDIEQLARVASPGPWSPDADGNEVLAEDGITVAEGFALSGPQLRATVEHIALNDPAYVLADIAAKRRIVDLYQDAERAAETIAEAGLPQGRAAVELAGYRQAAIALYQAVAATAEPFAEHPDYDPAWRPS